MQEFIFFDFEGVKVSESTISRHLLGMLYTMKQTRIEPATCNNDINKIKRQAFVQKLLAHQQQNDYIVYYDESNFNLYCKRSRGRSKKGTRATVVLPPSKGPNLQVQCAVYPADGLLCYRLERGSIRMDVNASYVEEIYQAVKNCSTWQNHYQGRNIVIVLDNAPAHSQAELRCIPHDDMHLLRLGPYSPMLNPIEGCFSVLKAAIKRFLGLRTDHMFDRRDFRTYLDARMNLLEEAVINSMGCISQHIVIREALLCQRNMEKALRLEDMQYGV
ncbi:hypothetical protein LEN26_002284 [Aphanomyces euteiches]|nr:hypothetical protein LEN26_002284 [Aphanomyces euteiches]